MRLPQSLRAHHSIAPGTGLITRAWLEIGHAHALLAPLHGAGAPFFYSALDTAQNAASSVALGSAVVRMLATMRAASTTSVVGRPSMRCGSLVRAAGVAKCQHCVA